MEQKVNWNDYFYYDGFDLRWARDSGSRAKKGSIAGHLSRGYRQLRIYGECFMVHRIIWEMEVGDIPEGMVIDHINHIRSDNRISNLRAVTVLENTRNASERKDNSSGVTGVTWDKFSSKWQAKISVKGKTVHLGRFNSLDDARIARRQAEAKYKFHKNHGA